MSTGSVYRPIAAMLTGNPHGALLALDQLAAPDRDTREAWDLRGRALFLLGRQHEAHGDAQTALVCWDQAVRCNDLSIMGQLGAAIEELCHREAWALAQAGRTPEAVQIVDRGLALVQSGRLSALREQLVTPVPPPRPAPPAPPVPRAAAPLPPPRPAAAVAAARPAAAAAPARPDTSGAHDSIGRTSRTVPFNGLPPAARRRFVECANGRAMPVPLNLEKSGGVAGPVVGFLAATGALVGFAALGFAEVGGSSYDPPATLIVYATLLFFAVLALLAVVRARIVRKGLPYAPGTYLFPADVVIADRAGSLRIRPLREMKSFKCVHHSTNGRYTHTLFHLAFADGTQRCRLSKQAYADAAVQKLSESERAQAAAARIGDVAAIEALDPLAAVPTAADADPASAPWVRPAPGWLRWRALAAAAAGLLLAVPAWAGRNALSDASLFAETERLGTEAAYRQYLGQGWLFRARARERLPHVAFAEAKRKGTVTALRAVLQTYPGSPVDADVRAEIRAAYEKSRARFRAQAQGADARMVGFLETLVDYMEKHDLSSLIVRFRSPNPAALAAADTRLAAQAAATARFMAPIAPHFADKSARLRETAIVDQLNKGFQAIFPADVLALTMGPRLPATGAVPSDVPAILIDYDVVPSGSLYQSSDRSVLSKLFVGIRVAFKVSMRVPDTPQPFDFDLDVAPPHQFTVNYDKTSAALAAFQGPPDERVYAVMAERAFDELSAKLRHAFFPAVAAAVPDRAVRPGARGPTTPPAVKPG